MYNGHIIKKDISTMFSTFIQHIINIFLHRSTRYMTDDEMARRGDVIDLRHL